jgi:predicted nucleotidyltransferase
MSQSETVKLIKTTVQSFLPDARVLLFGSRATAQANHTSDYDVLVITPLPIPSTQKSNWNSKIHKALVKAIQAPVDLIINSEAEAKLYKDFHGHIIRYALREGIEL